MLWMMTVIGLVLGAGDLWLGAGITAATFCVMWGLQFAEQLIKQDHRAALVVAGLADSISEDELRALIAEARLHVLVWSAAYRDEGRLREITCDLGWRSRRAETYEPAFVPALAKRTGIERIEWNPHSADVTPR